MAVAMVPAEPELVRYVTENMRAADRQEIYATRFTDSAEELAADVSSVNGFSWVAMRDGEPCAVIGAKPVWPGVWTVFAFGTDRWREVIIALTRHARNFMIPALERAGAHLGMCWSHAAHHTAHLWLMRLGAKREWHFAQMGRGREDFLLFVWRR